MPILSAKILENQERIAGSGIFFLKLIAPQIVQTAKTGQFIQVLVNQASCDPLLRRPFCIYRIDPDTDRLELLYQVVGKGTAILSQQPVGTELSLLGPVGSGYSLDPGQEKSLLIGGGMGWAGLNQLYQELIQKEADFELFFGARNHESFQATISAEKIIADWAATDDGSFGYHGFVTELVSQWLEKNPSVKPYIYACGPTPLLRAVQKLAQQHGLSGQMSLEARMACGFGVCLGCAVKKAEGVGYYKVCRDGPVFELNQVDFDE